MSPSTFVAQPAQPLSLASNLEFIRVSRVWGQHTGKRDETNHKFRIRFIDKNQKQTNGRGKETGNYEYLRAIGAGAIQRSPI